MPKTSRLIVLMLCTCVAVAGRVFGADDPLDAAIDRLDRLHTARVDLELTQVPLVQAFDELRDACGIVIRGDWPRLAALAIEPRDPISIRLEGVSAANALQTILLQVGDEFDQPWIEAAGDGILVTAPVHVRAFRSTAVYELRDLADALEQFEALVPPRPVAPAEAEDAAPAGEPDESEDEDQGEDEDETGAPDRDFLGAKPIDFDALRDETNEFVPTTPTQRLVDALVRHVATEAWERDGGDIARMSAHGGLAVVTAPPSVHRKLRRMLDQLRRAEAVSNLQLDVCIIETTEAALRRANRLPHDRAPYARALRTDRDATTLWQTAGAVAVGHVFRHRAPGDGGVALSLAPTFDRASGQLTLELEAERNGGLVSTRVVVPFPDGAVVVELERDGERVRMLLIVPTRS